MKRIALLMLGIVLISVNSNAAQNADEMQLKLKQARAAYDSNNYEQAINSYTELLEQGIDSAELCYNLGNAEFKSGKIGRALAYYRRAFKRKPSDEDIRYNLKYVRSLIPQPPDRSGPLAKWIKEFFLMFSGQKLALGAWFFYFAFLCLLAAMIIKRGGPLALRWSAGSMAAVFLLIAMWASFRIAAEKNTREGVIVVTQAEARNGPGEDYQVGFTVPEGREVRILGQEGEWRAIGLPREGYKGWVYQQEVWEDE